MINFFRHPVTTAATLIGLALSSAKDTYGIEPGVPKINTARLDNVEMVDVRNCEKLRSPNFTLCDLSPQFGNKLERPFSTTTNLPTAKGDMHVNQAIKKAEPLLSIIRGGETFSVKEFESKANEFVNYAAALKVIELAAARAVRMMEQGVTPSDAKLKGSSMKNVAPELNLNDLLTQIGRLHAIYQRSHGVEGQPSYKAEDGINSLLMGIIDAGTPQLAQSRGYPLQTPFVAASAILRGGLISGAKRDSLDLAWYQRLVTTAARQNMSTYRPKDTVVTANSAAKDYRAIFGPTVIKSQQ